MSNTTIPFGLTFKGQKDYTSHEVYMFIECANNIEPMSLQNKYIAFLEDFLSGKIKPSTQVELDIMELFYGDIDSRAQVDYREGHYCPVEEADVFNGGKYFDRMAKKLKVHIAKCT
ncbi:MAG: hypothetical protein CL833_08945 [Crocinitomicaceae bacterium]|mgnify:CR=1 FL=1|nr:hypothetical protein [Crocinitomicaceae bacterium]